MDKQLLLEELEIPRFTSCSFYAYSLSDLGDIVLLMRNKKDSKTSPFYVDFGTTLDEYPGNKDVNIIFAAARSYLQKTGGICLASELESMANSAELLKRISDYLAKREDQLSVHNSRVKEVFAGILQS